MASCRSDLSSVAELRRIQTGRGAWTQADLDKATASLQKALARFDEHLALRTYFVGHSVTLADLCFTATMAANRSTVLRDDQMKAYPNVMRHFNYMTQTTFFQAVMGRSFAPMKASLPLADSDKCMNSEQLQPNNKPQLKVKSNKEKEKAKRDNNNHKRRRKSQRRKRRRSLKKSQNP